MAKVIFHLKRGHLEQSFSRPHLRLYGVIEDMMNECGSSAVRQLRGADITVGTRQVADGRFNDGNLHIIDDRSVRMPNVLNAAMVYLKGYWHLDAQGTRCFSSIGDRGYSPKSVPFRRAKPFFQDLRERYAVRRRSRYGQPEEIARFPRGAIAVFFQGGQAKKAGASSFGDLDMLRDVLAGAGEKRVIVKPHPAAPQLDVLEGLAEIAAGDDRVMTVNANIHDILAASCVSVSINSAVALEGFLHRTPAILYGKADFHHICETLEAPGGFAAALARAQQKSGGYAQYMAWYFRRNCLQIGARDLESRIWQVFSEAGFPSERFRE